MTLLDRRLTGHIHWLQHMMADTDDINVLYEQQEAIINPEDENRNDNGAVDDEDVSTNY